MITLCRRHHGFVESHREWARDVGALVPKGVTAERCPVRTPHGWVLFAPDGSRRFVNLEGETS
jgi:hypothetical protein